MGWSYEDRGSTRTRAALLCALGCAAALLLPSAAGAAGTPDIGLDKQASATVLYGATSQVSLSASNPAGQPTGYNLSFRDVLPPGISYVPGSAPAIAGEPQVIADAPAVGQTTLIWSNLADLTASSSFSFSYEVAHDQGIYAVGDNYVNSAGAFINCDPRYVPDFDANGEPVLSGGNSDCTASPPEESYTGSATDTASTEISAVAIAKSEPSPEGELLRGLHAHQTVYTLTVTNNLVNATLSADVEDYIPAGLEFLGCGGVDNTSDAPTNPGSAEEYPGSGPINPGNEPGGWASAGCIAPSLVETVSNPPGLAPGVYTHVVWDDVADLAPSASITLRYIAAIPIRANTLTWPAGEPAPASGQQASNLDNNSGPETNEEGGSEPAYTNTASVDGLYQDGVTPGGLPVSDSDTETVSSEDLRILKSASSGTLSPGGITTWTLQIDTGEYRYVDSLEVTDTLGDGYCPLGSVNFEVTPPAASAECDPTGAMPSAPYLTATEAADGSWTLNWDETADPALARMQPSSSHTITFPTRTRAFYQQNFDDDTPVLARDAAGNDVALSGTDFVRCAPPGAADACVPNGPGEIDHDELSGTPDEDTSSAGQQALGASIDKRVDDAPNTADCLTGSYVDSPPTAVSPGDSICFRVRMDFPSAPQTGSVTVTDFIPPGTTYDVGSAQATANNTVTFATTSTTAEPDVTGSQLAWPLDDGGGTVTAGGQVFEVVFSVTVERATGDGDGDITQNLQKAVFSNTAGTSFPLRDSAGIELSQAELTLLKGVRDVDNVPGGGNGPNVDGVLVQPGSTVTYRVDISNSGSIPATSAEIWDILPPQIDCADVVVISDAGTCNAVDGRLEWNAIAIPAGGTTTLTYDVVIPDGLSPGDVLPNTAGVREYESPGGGGTFTNIPSGNIDPAQEPNANAGPADDPSNVIIQGVTLTKARTTALTEAGNTAGQATIGERISYTLTGTVFDGATLYGPDIALTDDIGTRQTLDASTLAATLDSDGPGGAPPVALPTAGLTLSVVGTTVRVDFPEPYANPLGSGDDIIVVTFTTTLDDDFPANQARGTNAQRNLPNTANLDWLRTDGAAQNRTASVSTRIVEPDIAVAKANDAVGPVSPGDTVGFTVTASNGGPATGTSVAHDVEVVDTVPVGLTPVNGAVPVPDGGTVGPQNGIWDEGTRTITWTITSLAPGASTALTYDALVNNDAIGAGALTNTVDATTTSLPDPLDDSGERTAASPGPAPGVPPDGYLASADSTIALTAGTIIKVSAPDERTIGDRVTHTVTVTLPANLIHYDAVVVDDLPDGLAFDSYGSATCTAGCAPGPTDITPATLTPVPNGDGTRIGWSLGDVASAPVVRVVTLVYTTHVEITYAGGAPVQRGDTLQNTATFAFNTTDDPAPPPTTPPDPTTYDEQRAASADTDVVEPTLEIDKDVSGDPDDDDQRTADPGSSFTYTLRITNTGDAPAYDVVVTDQPDVELTNVVPVLGAGQVTDPWTAADPAIAWLIPGPIAPSETVVLTYTADLVPSAQLLDDQQAINTADIPSYFGVPASERSTFGFDYIDYDDVAPDTVTVTVEIPALELTKTTGAGGFPDDAPAATGVPFSWRIVVTNPNAGSTLIGVDVTDTLPANWSYVPGSAQITGSGTLTPGGQVNPQVSGSGGTTLTWNDIADLGGGETVVITFDAVPLPLAAVDPGSGPANPNVNQAAGSGVDTSGAGASAAGPYADDDGAQATLATPSFDLQVEKSADRPDPPAGTVVTWTIVVRNNGPDAAPNVVLSDPVPAGTSFVSATPGQGSCSLAGGVVNCNLGTIGAGSQVVVAIKTKIDRAAAGQTIRNDVTVTDTAGNDTDPTNNDSTASVVAGAFSAGIAEACTGGAISVTPGRVWAGVPTTITARVTDTAGNPVEGAPVLFATEQKGAKVAAAQLTRETDAAGRATFKVQGPVGSTWTASVGLCKLTAKVAVKKLTSCGPMTVKPRSLASGRKSKIKVRLRSPDGDPMRGVRVKVQGAGAKRSGKTNKTGRATIVVRFRRGGVVKVRAPGATKCVVRLGVAGASAGSQLTG